MKRIALIALVVTAGCGNTQVVRVPVEANLAEREAPPTVMVNHTRVAVIRPDVVNDPERRVGFTNAFAESYPSMSHLVVAVPQALREVGFEVIEAPSVEDAQAGHAEYILQLTDPEVVSVHPADGDRVTLVGSAYDVRVRYKGKLVDKNADPLGVVIGYGQDTARFLFMEPLFKQALVGAAISAATLLASIFVLLVIFQFGLVGTLAVGKDDPFGRCGQFGAAKEFCTQAANYLISFVFVTTVSLVTGVAGSIGGKLGENVVDVGLSLAHMTTVDPSWRGMVKNAHDSAARDLATAVADRALHPYQRPAAPPPPPTPVPAPVPNPG